MSTELHEKAIDKAIQIHGLQGSPFTVQDVVDTAQALEEFLTPSRDLNVSLIAIKDATIDALRKHRNGRIIPGYSPGAVLDELMNDVAPHYREANDL